MLPAMNTSTTPTAQATITIAPERRVKAGMVPSLIDPSWTAGQTGDKAGWFAAIDTDGLSLQVSRMDGESAWTIDAAYRWGSSFPIFANGYGARYLRTRTLAAPLAALLDDAIAAEDAADAAAEEAHDAWAAGWTDDSGTWPAGWE